MSNTKAIDMTHLDDMVELAPDGYLDTTDNLAELFEELIEKGLFDSNPSLKVFVSYIKGRDNNQKRESKVITRTLDELKAYYQTWHGKPYNSAVYHEAKAFRMEAIERQGQRRAGWGNYVATMNYEASIQEEQQHRQQVKQAGTHREKEKLEKEREKTRRKQSPIIHIG